MKKHFWLIVVLGVLSLILVSCGCTVSATPTLSMPSSGLRTSDGTLTLTGTGLPDHDVQLMVDGQVAGVTRTGENGAWSLGITLTEPGEHELRVQTLAFNGVVIGEAGPFTATMAEVAEPEEAPAPAAVEIKPPTLKLPAGAAELVAGALALTGTGAPGSEVQVVADGEVAGVAQVDTGGSWSLEITLAEAGEHEVTVKTLDASGDVIAEAEPVSLSLAPPAIEVRAPTLKLPAGAAELAAGVLPLAGTGEPGSEVQVVVDGQVAGITRASDDGSWSLELTLGEAGDHELVVKTLDASRELIAETEPVSLSLAPSAVDVKAPALKLPAGGVELKAGTLALTGTGEPGSEVQITVDGEVAGVAPVNDDGSWSLELPITEAGEHELVMQTLDASGQAVAKAEPVSFSLTPTGRVLPAPNLLFPADGADVITGQFIVGQLTLIGSGEPGTDVEILDGSDVLDRTEVNAEGEWYYTFEPEAGTHRFAARSIADTTATSNAIQVRVARPDDGIDCNSNPGMDRISQYVVGTCDTLSGIGRELGVSLDAVIGANPEIEDPDLIFPGQLVTIP